MTNTTNFELNPTVFTAEYISTHLLPVIKKPSNDDTLVKEPFLDLELTFKVILKDSDTGLTTYRLTKSLADGLHMDIEYLKNCARLNNFNKLTCQSMSDIFGFPGAMDDMYVLSNQSRNLGAGTAFLCTRPLQELCRKWGTDTLVIIPSSIHELICIRANIADAEFINQMIKDVNEGVVSEREQLSDHHYIYHADTDTFSC